MQLWRTIRIVPAPWFCVLLLVPVLAAAGCSGNSRTAAGKPERQSFRLNPSPPHIQARITYEDAAGVWVRPIPGTNSTLVLRSGHYPRWSPDGRYIAAHDGSLLWLVDPDASSHRRLARVEKPRVLGWAQDGSGIFFTDGRILKRLDLNTGHVADLIKGKRIREISAERPAGRLAFTLKTVAGFSVCLFDLQQQHLQRLRSGCSASLSPDGGTVTVNDRDHHLLHLVDCEQGRTLTIHTPDVPLDNHKWSNNRYWIAAVSDPPERGIYLYDLLHGCLHPIPGVKNVDRPDLYVISACR